MEPHDEIEPAVQDLLGADSVLPEQFWNLHDDTTQLSGERALMWAVFADGIDTYRRNAHGTSLRQRTEFKEAEHWVLSTDWDWPFSFVNLCETFGFSPEGVRGVLVRLKTDRHTNAFRRQRFRPVTLHAA
jgi:hypothetical protein